MLAVSLMQIYKHKCVSLIILSPMPFFTPPQDSGCSADEHSPVGALTPQGVTSSFLALSEACEEDA